MWASPWTGRPERSSVERGADVDHGRLEQRVGDGRAAELGRAVVEAERPPSWSSARRASV